MSVICLVGSGISSRMQRIFNCYYKNTHTNEDGIIKLIGLMT